MEIGRFYAGTNVLITGGTGFFGKMLVQKLLRVHEDIAVIYLIVRRKKDKSPEDRMQELYGNAVFDVLRKQKPDFHRKIVIVPGDFAQVGLDLADADRKLLQEKVDVVFHCAANLNMNAKLKDAVNVNVRGTKELLAICREMKNLKSLAVVSTAYARCVLSEIDERLYESSLDDSLLVEMVNCIEDKTLEEITQSLIGDYPNTYAYSKSVLENAILTKSGDLPVHVFRPTIVMPTVKDPLPGWTDNVYGPVGLGLAVTGGFCRVLRAKRSNKLDTVPVDFCVDALICSVCDAFRKRLEDPATVPVYNYSAGEYKRTVGEFVDTTLLTIEYPPKDVMWKPICLTAEHDNTYAFLCFLLHTFPGAIIDGLLVLIGRKAQMLQGYRKFYKLASVLSYFSTREWSIKSDNVRQMWHQLSEEEKSSYNFDMNAWNWEEYIRDVLVGGKVYVLKEPLSPADKKKLRKLAGLHNVIVFLVRVLLIWTVYRIVRYFCSG